MDPIPPDNQAALGAGFDYSGATTDAKEYAHLQAAAGDAQLLYDFLRMPTSPPPTKADAILVLGSNDVRVAKRAAELHAAGLAPLVVFSGSRGARPVGRPRVHEPPLREVRNRVE